ncbi:MAG: PAS domain S-box protein [Leptolyngbyaceae cyanobacterium RU_5_1]|nr:PAS domain S-box protein [Leptolyngbyaceae cyanobacterium RU_5_1]
MSKFERLEHLAHKLTRVQTDLGEFFEIPPDLFAVLQLDGSFQWVSPTWEELVGWTPAVLHRRCWTEFIHPHDISFSQHFLKLLQTSASQRAKNSLKNRFQRGDGRYQWLSWNFRLSHEEDVYAVVRLIEQPSLIADSPHQRVLEAAEIGCFQLGVNGRYTSVSTAMARMHGYISQEEMLKGLADPQQPTCVEMSRFAELLKLLRQHRTIKEFELQTYCRNGSVLWISLTVQSVLGEQGTLLCYEGIAVDISRRKRAEADRMQLLACEQAARIKAEIVEQRFRELIDGLTDAIVWECNPETLQFTFVSRSAERILGYPVEQWQSKPGFWVHILHPDDRNWVVAFCQEETKQGRDHEFEYRCFTNDGRIIGFAIM